VRADDFTAYPVWNVVEKLLSSESVHIAQAYAGTLRWGADLIYYSKYFVESLNEVASRCIVLRIKCDEIRRQGDLPQSIL
jgi:hypothetical protein